MKQLFFTFILSVMIIATTQAQKPSDDQTIYRSTIADIGGKPFDLPTLKGKRMMIVNIASKCGLTPQYKELGTLYERYRDRDFVIIGSPANNFLGQKPGSDKQIASFCSINYRVSSPMMSKISVKGKETYPLYQLLTRKEKSEVEDSKVRWNLQRYPIGKGRRLEEIIAPRTLPSNEEIIQWIGR